MMHDDKSENYQLRKLKQSLDNLYSIYNPSESAQEFVFSVNPYTYLDFLMSGLSDKQLNDSSTKVIQNHKHRIIEMILERLSFAMNYHEDYERKEFMDKIIKCISKLRKIGINWDELDIILKSMESEK